jgi:copper chaperone CopZ
MKNIIAIALLIMAGLSLKAAEIRTDTITVSGKCEMCGMRITSAARIKGVQSVSWDMNTKKLTVTYDIEKVSLGRIEQRLAAAGHDTEHVKASENAYQSLHKCCKYRTGQCLH